MAVQTAMTKTQNKGGVTMNSFRVEVAICFMDRTWESTPIIVEHFPEEEAEKAAEDKVLADLVVHRTKVVSFVKAIHIEPTEEEG